MDERYFENVFGRIEDLSLIGGFIARSVINEKFPHLKAITIISNEDLEKQCAELLFENIKVTGCEAGNL